MVINYILIWQILPKVLKKKIGRQLNEFSVRLANHISPTLAESFDSVVYCTEVLCNRV